MGVSDDLCQQNQRNDMLVGEKFGSAQKLMTTEACSAHLSSEEDEWLKPYLRKIHWALAASLGIDEL